jgi:hypothetical protein
MVIDLTHSGIYVAIRPAGNNFNHTSDSLL